MRNTTTLALGSAFVTLTSGTSALLGRGLLTGTPHHAEVFGFLKNVAILVLPVVVHIMDDVSAHRQVVNFMVQFVDLPSESSCLEVPNRHLQLRVKLEGSIAP